MDAPISVTPRRSVTPLLAFRRGIGAACRHLPVAIAMWAVNLVFALPLAVAYRSAIAPAATTPFGATEGGSYLWLTEAIRTGSGALEAIASAAGVLALIAMATSSLVAAGAIEVLAYSERGGNFRAFAGGVARFGGRFFRLFLAILVLVFCVLWVMNGPIAGALERYFDGAADERWAIAATWSRYAVTGLLLGSIVLVADFAKVRIVLDDAPSAWAELARAAAYVFTRRPGAIVLFVLCEVVSLAVLGVGALAGRLSLPDAMWAVLAALALQQVALLARMWARLVFWASELELVRDER